MNIFDFEHYKTYVLNRIRSMPRGGHGEFRHIAKSLRVHPTMVSQIFRGDKELTREQAVELCEHFGMADYESQYFLALVDLERAGTKKLKQRIQAQLTALKAASLKLSARMPAEKKLTDEARATFYTNWQYSGIRLLSSIEGYQTVDSIADYFGIPKSRVGKIIEFLVGHGLCVSEDGEIRMGAKQTHLEADSPLIQRHHANWRIKAMQAHESLSAEELCYTGPMSISKKDFEKIRELIAQTVQQTTKIAVNSGEEILACLNVDWFKF